MPSTESWWQVLRRAGKRSSKIDADQRAAAFSYHAFLALFPCSLVLLTAGWLCVASALALLLLGGIMAWVFAFQHTPKDATLGEQMS